MNGQARSFVNQIEKKTTIYNKEKYKTKLVILN